MITQVELRRPADDDIDDICDEFGIDPGFVEMTWMIIEKIGGKAPGSKFIPRNRRELALVCCIAFASQETES